MRKIKFRAWNIGNKEMLDVQELDYQDNYNGQPMVRTTMYNDYFDTEDMILMQYTGLKDKNGKEIYEGDIVKSNNQLSIIRYGVINVDCCGCCYNYHKIVGFYLENLKAIINKGFTNLDEDTIENLEVIGNIYENKELLEEKE